MKGEKVKELITDISNSISGQVEVSQVGYIEECSIMNGCDLI